MDKLIIHQLFGNLSNPTPEHTKGGSRRGGARRGGGAGQGRTGRRRVASPRRHPSPLPPQGFSRAGHRIQLSWTFLRKHEQTKSYVNRWRNTTSGWRAVDERLIRGMTAALGSLLLTNGPSPICLCKPFSCKACSGNLSNRMIEQIV